MILQDVRQIVNAFSRVVTALKTAISPFIFLDIDARLWLCSLWRG
jgi:hypothetical protein